ncbi:PREDICTED: uncharacterized protein LOC108782832 [Cyphomyrmex costatus]|uniref:Uncharacterized protein n=1 Tax=Cyphomyrmex costatus TaxID=456900 RepID=A0A195D1I0_9HYME|nr:PREDICTED: uncharacterized protein LOC108782832 [Cyphomyrmex costatus]KYN06701.1 hypothetical protein ALC62_02359 [Cyphomyrmex costatus]
MNLYTRTTIAGGCLRLEASWRIETRRTNRDKKRGSTPKASLATRRRFTRRQITELLFENCIDCGKMASIPQSAFAVCKVRCNEEQIVSIMKKKEKTEEKKENVFNPRPPLEGWELMPLKYNSKLMNSIWGLYNRYSVHNFKKNTDAEKGGRGGVAAAIWGTILEKQPSANAAVTATVIAPQIIKTKNRL